MIIQYTTAEHVTLRGFNLDDLTAYLISQTTQEIEKIITNCTY